MISFPIPNPNPSSPAYKRLRAIKTALEDEGIKTVWENEEKAALAKIRYVSFPPFPRLKDLVKLIRCSVPLIIEYRDGWSLAIKTGYGGTRKPRLIKGLIARLIEMVLSVVAAKLVSVTPGLLQWHGKKHCLFLPNGSEIEAPRKKKPVDLDKPKLRLVCFGKFASYGDDNIQKALKVLHQRYKGKSIEIDIYSENPAEAQFTHHYDNIDIALKSPVRPSQLCSFLRNYDLGIAIIRDLKYDFGTKIFDYAQAGLPILNYYDDTSDLIEFFKGSFDMDKQPERPKDYSRLAMLRSHDLDSLVKTIRELETA